MEQLSNECYIFTENILIQKYAISFIKIKIYSTSNTMKVCLILLSIVYSQDENRQ